MKQNQRSESSSFSYYLTFCNIWILNYSLHLYYIRVINKITSATARYSFVQIPCLFSPSNSMEVKFSNFFLPHKNWHTELLTIWLLWCPIYAISYKRVVYLSIKEDWTRYITQFLNARCSLLKNGHTYWYSWKCINNISVCFVGDNDIDTLSMRCRDWVL